MSFLADPENRLSAKSTKVAICITVATLVERELQEVAQQGSRLVRLTMISTPSLQKKSISSSGTLGTPSKKVRDYLGIFPNIGGGSPQSPNFCDLTK